MMTQPKSFRPLSGNYISKSQLSTGHGYSGTGFRPLSGNYISKSADFENDEGNFPWFPSPLGELHFQIEDPGMVLMVYNGFPSPLGELHFQILQSYHLYISLNLGFRPLSGNYISKCISY